MKKGLLSLLAVTLTIVSCQNYDDQFAELTGLVNKLSTEVQGITEVKNNLTTLTSTVGTLQTAIGSIPDPTANILAITSGLASATTQIDLIKGILDAGITTPADLAAVNQLINDVQAGVTSLLSKNGNISQSIIINSPTTLENAKRIIETGAGTPNGYIMSGNLTVNHSLSASVTLSQAQIDEANLLTKKIISIVGNVSVKGAVDLSGLVGITGAYDINGATAPLDASVVNVSGAVTIDGKQGAISTDHILTAASLTIDGTVASVTSIDLSSVAATTGALNSGTLSVPSITTGAINLGLFSVTSVTFVNATGNVILGQKASAGLTIHAKKAAQIWAKEITANTVGNVSVTGSNTTIVRFDKLKTSSDDIETLTYKVAEFHIPALVASTNVVSVTSKVVDARSLKTIDGIADFNSSNVVVLSSLASVTAALNLNTDGGVVIPTADFSGGGVLSTTATNVSVLRSDANFADVAPATVVSLTLASHRHAVTGVPSGLLELDVTTPYRLAFGLVIGNAAALTHLKVNGYDTVAIGVAAGVEMLLEVVETAGSISTLNISGADVLHTLTIGHTAPALSPAGAVAEIQSVILTELDILKAVDLSSVSRLGYGWVASNSALDVITAPAVGTPLISGSGLTVTLHVTGNSLLATYTQSVAGGSSTTLQQPSLNSWKAYIGQMVAAGVTGETAVNSLTYDLDFDQDKDGNRTATAEADFTGTIDTAAELALITN